MITAARLRQWRKAWFVAHNAEVCSALDIADRAAEAKDARALLATRVHAAERFAYYQGKQTKLQRAARVVDLRVTYDLELWDAVLSYTDALLAVQRGDEPVDIDALRTAFAKAATFERFVGLGPTDTKAWSEMHAAPWAAEFGKWKTIEGEVWTGGVN